MNTNNIVFTGQPKYLCNVHGEILEVMTSTLERQTEFICMRCYWKHLKDELGLVQPKDYGN